MEESKKRIGLVDVDGHNFPNLAQMKISAFYKKKKCVVEQCLPFTQYDIVYCSKVFSFSKDVDFHIWCDCIVYGGTGYGMNTELPAEIEHMYPDYDLYPEFTKDTAFGFLTRGCPRGCKFCIVKEKEGTISHKVSDLREFWNGQRFIKLLDPNILACNEHEKLFVDLIDSGSYIDFTQGVDIRLLNNDDMKLLNKMRMKSIHFAWDNANDSFTERQFVKFSNCFRKGNGAIVYVLTNFNSTLEEDLYRVNTLRKLNYKPYIMVYDKQHSPAIIRSLQRYVNNRKLFYSIDSFEDYCLIFTRDIYD